MLIAADANGNPASHAAGVLIDPSQNVVLRGGTQVVLALMQPGNKNGNRR